MQREGERGSFTCWFNRALHANVIYLHSRIHVIGLSYRWVALLHIIAFAWLKITKSREQASCYLGLHVIKESIYFHIAVWAYKCHVRVKKEKKKVILICDLLNVWSLSVRPWLLITIKTIYAHLFTGWYILIVAWFLIFPEIYM